MAAMLGAGAAAEHELPGVQGVVRARSGQVPALHGRTHAWQPPVMPTLHPMIGVDGVVNPEAVDVRWKSRSSCFLM